MNIKLTDKDKIRVSDAEDVYGIMQRILLRDNKIDREKEHFWIVGMNNGGYIVYIELVSLGSTTRTLVEPMNVFRVAILKGAIRIIAVHNHPGGTMKPSKEDKDLTDKLIQVGKIINIKVEDHLIISPTTYISFKNMDLMEKLENSNQYIPTYQLIEKIRKEEQIIREDAIKVEKTLRTEAESKLNSVINYLLEKEMTFEQIAKILNITPSEVQKISKKKPKRKRTI
ncbi:MAG: JAB domain-containing protein [Tannerella sp.]|jgi:DNA repair protein RadC|nr:JAB domain-containing protein [Tannerella sp.]